ncbi:MAG TPA: SDR family oxidoreductase [Gemmatimonadales bacterium]|nr:SDR family oxidoreductase [Gemmatimonadales bacterium]
MSALTGRSALVTGASRGIGLAVADALEADGALVVRVARGVESRAGETALLRGGVDRRIELRCDVTREDEVRRLADTVRETVGAPDILVNNAGAFVLKPLAETSAEEFRRQLEVNLAGAFLVLRALVPAMAERGGHVVTIGSIADHAAYPGNAGYAASKFGLRGLHETVKAEYAGRGLRFTLVSPGPTDTPLWDAVDPDRHGDLPDRARMLHPSDVADAVRFVVTRPPRANVELLRLMPA